MSTRFKLKGLAVAVFVGVMCAFGQDAHAIVVTQDSSAASLAAVLTGGSTGITNVGASLSGFNTVAGVSSGTYTNASLTYNIGSGVVLSSGDVANYGDGPNTSTGLTTNYATAATAAQELLLDPITGGGFQHFDVTQLDITFDMEAGFDTVFFNIAFGSEEFPEWVDTTFIDGFGLFVNGTNIAFVDGLPVNINHPNMAAIPGTELDGVLLNNAGTAFHTFSHFVGDGSSANTLTFIVADSSDNILDTTVYISALGGTPPPPVGVIPEPSSMMLLGMGLAGGAARSFRKKARKA